MSEETISVPGKHLSIKTTTKTSTTDELTTHSSVMKFDEVKHLLSEKPLRPPVRSEKQ